VLLQLIGASLNRDPLAVAGERPPSIPDFSINVARYHPFERTY
jgi:hypothetical protein